MLVPVLLSLCSRCSGDGELPAGVDASFVGRGVEKLLLEGGKIWKAMTAS
jgi:hypothetical protein